MQHHPISDKALAASITRAASQQTYYTVRFLVDRPLVADAFRAYAYFRWVDDWVDKQTRPRSERLAFIQRQQSLVEACSRGESMTDLANEEHMLVSLMRGNTDKDSGLQAYIHNLMAVMAFDADRRGRLISQRELSEYSHNLSVAVTEAMHYFVGRCCPTPHCEARYSAVTGAHITHMLRDTIEDTKAGYYNIPAEVVSLHGIDPGDVTSPVYRNWVKERVREAKACFYVGREYLARVKNFRCRLAGYAYTGRFEWILQAIQTDNYLLRDSYLESQPKKGGLNLFWEAFWQACHRPSVQPLSHALPVR